MTKILKGYCKKCKAKKEVYIKEAIKDKDGVFELKFACVDCKTPVLPD